MKRAIVVLALMCTVIVGSRHMLSLQDDDAAAAARKELREAAAAAKEAAEEAARAAELRAARNEIARQEMINKEREQSDARLTAAVNEAREAKSRENEVKFDGLRRSAKELMDLSARTYNQINAGGAQSVSLTVYSDVERMEKLVKEIRKSLK